VLAALVEVVLRPVKTGRPKKSAQSIRPPSNFGGGVSFDQGDYYGGPARKEVVTLFELSLATTGKRPMRDTTAAR
jgi:hypothetical protein